MDLDGVPIVSSVCCELIFRIFAVSPTNCTRCRFNCADKVPENIRLEMFCLLYDENMVYERKRDLSIIGKDIICCRIESKVSSDVLLGGVCFPPLSVPSKVP
jgi:hypothetical protein